MRRIILAIILAVNTLMAAMAQVGTWRNYLSYYEPQQAEDAGNYLFVLASNALYQYNRNDQSITTYDKTNGMSDVYITQIAWNNNVKRLIAVYENSNIDIISTTGEIVNLPDFYSKSMTDDKTVNSIYVNGKYAYLSTGFGIVKVNMENVEISETYNLGFKVNYSYIEGSTIYAASQSQGIYSAPLSANLLDKSNWQYSKAYVAKTKTIDDETLALIKTLSPGGPKYNYFNYIYFKNDRLYTSGGGWTTGTEYNYPGCVQVLKDNEWEIYQDDLILPHGVSYKDVTSLAIDPSDPEHVYASNVHCGIIEFQNGKYVQNYTFGNSSLHSTIINTDSTEDYNYVRTDGLIFDNDGNLFALNSTSPNAIVEYTKDNEWKAFNFKELVFEGLANKSLGIMRRSILDGNGLIWFCNDHNTHPSLFCFDPSSDTILDFNTFYNQDGTAFLVNAVKYVISDKDGYIWIGTNCGPFMLNANQKTNPTAGYTQVKIPRNDGTNLADYLLSGIEIKCIAVDGANRKWFGTGNNGIFVLNSTNDEQIYHFTTENSGLLSNDINDLAINNSNGEVYVATSKGLCSYMSDASEASDEMTSDNVYAYPNPIEPSFTGAVTIVGLTYNADVKIVSSNGAIVNSGKSTGGSYQWNCCDNKGNHVASGIYMVVTAKEDGTKGTVCKIAILR